MTDKGLNLFDESAAECVHLCPQEKKYTSSSWAKGKMYTSSNIANSQKKPTKINKNGAIAKVRILGKQVIL